MSSKLQKALERYFQAWQDLLFFLYMCFSSCFMFAHFIFFVLGISEVSCFMIPIFYIMMDESSFPSNAGAPSSTSTRAGRPGHFF